MYDTSDALLREILAGEDSHIEFKGIIFEGKKLQFGAAGPGDDKPSSELAKDLAADETGDFHPTAVGLRLFSRKPQNWLPGACVDLVAYRSKVPDAAFQVDAKQIGGTVVEQIERAMDYLRASPFVPTAATKDERGRLDQPAYSLRALQEAVVNALVHRDYGLSGAQIRIFLFPDRIVISNPGRLHNTLVPAHLFAGCQPIRRNQLLAGCLRDYPSPLTGRSYMEGRGEGFLAMVRECERVSGRRPDLRLIGDGVELTIWARTTGDSASSTAG